MRKGGFGGRRCKGIDEKEGAMDIVAVVELMSFVIFGLFVISVVTPSRVDARRSRRY